MLRSAYVAAVAAMLVATACGSTSKERDRSSETVVTPLSHGVLFTVLVDVGDSGGDGATKQDLLDVLILAPGEPGGGGVIQGVKWRGTRERRGLGFDFVEGGAPAHGTLELVDDWELRGGGDVFDLRLGNLLVVHPGGPNGFNVHQLRFVLKNGTDAATRLARFKELLPDDAEVRGLTIRP